MRNIKYRGLGNNSFHHRGIGGKSQGIYPYGRLMISEKIIQAGGNVWARGSVTLFNDIIPLMVSRLPNVGTFGDAIEIDFVGVVE
jgi:hypothetical protein